MEVCTIIAKNYVAYARVLARSLAETHPGSRLRTLVVDDFQSYLDPAAEPFETLTPADIGCEPFTHMALRYSVLELSTAVKPWLLRHLMTRSGGPVTYLDPDIAIFGSLDHLDELADRHGVVLTPHSTTPIPPDGRRPGQVDVMISGAFNLGYVSVAPHSEVTTMLDWWADRLTRDCRVDPIWGYFVDQRWFDLAPSFMSDLAIVREPEYNVAYWNLHERRLAHADDGYRVNGRPLAFFHFSGFDADHPSVLSRYQDRVDVSADPALQRILGEYAKQVLADGHSTSRHWPYGYGVLGDGTKLDDTLRALCGEYLDAGHADAMSLFTVAGAREFERWAQEQAPGGPPGVNRILQRLYERRLDLWRAYTRNGREDGPGLLRWATVHGPTEEPVIAHLLTDTTPASAVGSERGSGVEHDDAAASNGGAPAAAQDRGGSSLGPDRPEPNAPHDTTGPLHREPFGVNVVGYFRSEVGTGEAARQMVAALDSQAIPVLPIHGRSIPVSRQNHPYQTATPDQAPFPVNLICMNADMLPGFVREAGAEFFAGRYSIGLWFWEVSTFPDHLRDSFSLLEEVWAPTEHIAAALRPLATVPVHVVRLPVSPPPLERTDDGPPMTEPGSFTFLFSFDYLSVAERKNPLATIEAFRRGFEPGEGAELVIKCINSDRDPAYHARVVAAAGAHPNVKLIDEYLDPLQNAALAASCDCYVSLHRAEGFGLVLADAMWHGKPVIATGYSGNLDFMTETNSLLVDHKLVPIGAGFDPYPPEGHWADPDLDHAARLMRRVFEDRDWARQLGKNGAAEIRRTHSTAAAGEILAGRLESIRATGRVRPRRWSSTRRSDAMAELPLTIRQGPEGFNPAPGPKRLLRSAALRVMRPFTAYQQAINNKLTDAVSDTVEGVGDVRRDAANDLARVLTELRESQELLTLRAQVAEQEQRIAQLERRLTGQTPEAPGAGDPAESPSEPAP